MGDYQWFLYDYQFHCCYAFNVFDFLQSLCSFAQGKWEGWTFFLVFEFTLDRVLMRVGGGKTFWGKMLAGREISAVHIISQQSQILGEIRARRTLKLFFIRNTTVEENASEKEESITRSLQLPWWHISTVPLAIFLFLCPQWDERRWLS